MIVGGSKCALADKDCRGRLEWHHAVKQQRLRREFKYGAYRSSPDFAWSPLTRHGPPNGGWDYWPDYALRTLDDILGDPRNRVWLCSHHHELTTNGRVQPELPDSVWEFARNDIARRSAA